MKKYYNLTRGSLIIFELDQRLRRLFVLLIDNRHFDRLESKECALVLELGGIEG